MNKKIILLLLAIVLIFCATSAVSAADISVSDVAEDNSVTVDAVSVANDAANIASVDTTSDNNKSISDLSASAKEDDKEINSLGVVRNVTDYNSLKTALNDASDGDIINITSSFDFDTSRGNGALKVAKSVTIISENGAVLNGMNSVRFFNITTSNVNISGITFINGSANKGGAINIASGLSDINIEHCTFTSNKASSSYSMGGAVFVGSKDYNINIENCTFIKNNADYGGAVRFDGTNASDNGPYNCIIKDCYFLNNTANTHGGAVCSFGYNISVINTTFESNSAPYSGAFHSHGSGVTWIGCDFTGNKATGTSKGTGFGGAVSLLDDMKSSYKNLGFNFTGCIFERNNATDYGGAIEIKGNYANISDCVFISNEAKNTGAAININGNYTDITGVNMTGNKAINGAGIYINGKSATVSDSNINNNTATTNGAGIYITGDNAMVDGVNITGNKAVNGSGVYITGDYVIVNNSNISSNNATNAGAAVWIKGDNTNILNSDIEDNYADKKGGAIYIEGSKTLIDNSTFYSNEVNHIGKSADGLGGAFYVSGDNTKISYSKFDGNIACNGSAIYADGSISIVNDTFLANQARIYKMPVENNGTHVNSTLEGGDNILNAIYYSGNLNNFNFTGNITKNGIVYNYTNEHPVEGVGNSSNGTKPYRDVHEEGQKVTLTLKNATGVVDELNCTTDLGGKVVYALSQDVIDSINRGNWYVASLYHGEDDFYTEISNSTVIGSNSTLSINNMTFRVGNASEFVYGALMNNITREMIPDAFISLNVTDMNGNLLFNFNATTHNHTDKDNREGEFWANVTNELNKLPVGLYKLNGVTSNATSGNRVYGLAYINVTPTPTSLSAENITQSYPYENHTITVNVTDLINATKIVDEGKVEITLPNGTKINATVENGVATFKDIYSDRIGNFSLDVKYYGDEYYEDSTGEYIWNVSAIPAPSVTKTSNTSGKKVKKDDLVEYTITVTNNANITVIYTVVDDLTNGLVYNSTNTTANVNGQKVTWTITLAPNEVREISLVTRVNTSNTQLSNTVTIGNGTSNVSANATNNDVDVEKLANITVEKTVDITSIQYSGIIDWTIVVTNNGPDTAEDVNVTEIFGNGLEFDSIKYISVGNYNNSTNVWSIGDLNKGNTARLIISTKVTTNSGNVTNTVNVTSPTPDVKDNGTVVPDVNKTTNVSVPVTPLSNPEVTKRANATQVVSGSEVKYTITIKNDNTVDLKYNITDTMDKGLVFVSTNTTGYNLNITDDKVILSWKDFTISAGETVVIEVIARVNASDIKLNNTVNVTNEDLDMNSSSATVIVGNLANITVTKVLNDTSITKVYRGDVVVWKIVVVNNGPDAAEYVNITDVIGSGLEYINSTGGSYVDGVVKWYYDELLNGQSVVLYVTTRVTSNEGNITNTVHVVSPTADVDENGTVVPTVDKTNTTEPTDVGTLVDPKVNKTAEPYNPVTKYIKDGLVKYIITVTNPNDIAIVYNVVDTLDGGLVFVEEGSTEGYAIDGQTVSWNVTVGANSEVNITLIANITKSNCNITNTVTVGNTTRDVGNSSEVNITVDKLANITVTKSLNDTSIVEVYRGDVVVWKIVVTNNGPDDAENVTVIDQFDSNVLEFVNATGTYTRESNNTVKWYYDELVNGETKYLYITTRVLSNVGDITNAVNVTSPTSGVVNETTTPETNKTTNKTVPVITLVDPTVDKTVESKVKYVKSDVIAYTITVTNPNKIAIVYNVVDTLDYGLVFVEEGSTEGYAIDGQTVSWNVTVGANSNATITLMALINASEINLTNTVTAGNITRELNNTDNVTITVDNLANITVTKIANVTDGDIVSYGDIIDYVICVENYGPGTARNVTVIDSLPKGLEFVSYNASTGTYDASTGVWTVGDLVSDGVELISIKAKVALKHGEIINIANVLSPTSDIDENGTVVPSVNKTTNVSVTVKKLDVIITIPDVNGTAGEKVTVDISVVDERGNPVTNEKLTVTLPDGSVVTVPVVDGIARVEFVLPAAGTYKIYASLTGSDYYNDAEAEGIVVSVANETPEPTPVHGIPMQHTGSPLAILALILMVLSGCTYRFKKE